MKLHTYLLALITVTLTQTKTYLYPVKAPTCKVCPEITYNNIDGLLFRSIKMGKYDEVKKWLCLGANPNAKDKFGNTPLIQAAWEGDTHIIRILLQNGAEIDGVNNDKQSALMVAVLNVKRCAIIELLNQGANIDLQDCHGNSAIMSATFISKIKPSRDVVCMLLQYKPDLKLKNECRDTLLTLAVRTNRYYLVEDITYHLNNRLTFEERYKILNQRNCDKETAFLIATQLFDNKIACFLLEQGVDIEKPNRYGNSPLMIAVLRRNIRLMNMLLDCGVDINHQNCWGYTALMFSVINDHVLMTKTLLRHCAGIAIKNFRGNNAIDIAKKSLYLHEAYKLEKKLTSLK